MRRHSLISTLLIVCTLAACVADNSAGTLEEIDQSQSAATICSTAEVEDEGWVAGLAEFYVFDQINAELNESEGLRAFTGLSSVDNCTEAQDYMRLRTEYEISFPGVDPDGPILEQAHRPIEVDLTEDGEYRNVQPGGRVGANGPQSRSTKNVRIIVEDGIRPGLDASCAGTIIAPDVVLTAASCLPLTNRRAVSVIDEEGAHLHTLANLSRHPRYSGTGDSRNDIGLVQLDSSFGDFLDHKTKLMVKRTWKNAPYIDGYGMRPIPGQ